MQHRPNQGYFQTPGHSSTGTHTHTQNNIDIRDTDLSMNNSHFDLNSDHRHLINKNVISPDTWDILGLISLALFKVQVQIIKSDLKWKMALSFPLHYIILHFVLLCYAWCHYFFFSSSSSVVCVCMCFVDHFKMRWRSLYRSRKITKKPMFDCIYLTDLSADVCNGVSFSPIRFFMLLCYVY